MISEKMAKMASGGSVIRASERNGVPAPTHRAMVQLVHAMEQKHQA